MNPNPRSDTTFLTVPFGIAISPSLELRFRRTGLFERRVWAARCDRPKSGRFRGTLTDVGLEGSVRAEATYCQSPSLSSCGRGPFSKATAAPRARLLQPLLLLLRVRLRPGRPLRHQGRPAAGLR